MSARSEAKATPAPETDVDVDSPERDAQALELRGSGRSFANVARALGYDKAKDANLAFNRALRRLPVKARAKARKSEVARLDALAARVNASEDLDADEAARQLRVVERLRARLLAD
jgi:hypothetical protein